MIIAKPPTGKPQPPPKTRAVVYPTSDGKPMAETDLHADLMVYFKEALRAFYAQPGQQRTAYVSGNNFLFWQEGDPKKRVSPDCYVVFDVTPGPRDSYMAWKEGGKLPAIVFEFTSCKTQREDTATKLPLYERVLQVPEYFQFDPTGDYLNPRLQGFRLDSNGAYRPIPLAGDRMHSEQLNLDLVLERDTVRLYDPVRNAFLLTPQEQAARAEAEATRAEAEAAARAAAEAENERLRTELDALRRQLRGET